MGLGGRRRFSYHLVLLKIVIFLLPLSGFPFVLFHGRLVIKFVELKGIPVLDPDIFTSRKTVQVEDQMEHFFVGLLVVERNDWDSIINLVCKRVDGVINDDHVFHSSIGNDS